MAIVTNFKKGIDIPTWLWMRQISVTSQPGTSTCWDGTRYIYIAIQSGSATAGTASTSQLWRLDTFTNGYQFLATLTSGSAGMSIVYDPIRNVLYITTGAALTSWQVFNLNITSVTICNTACAAWALTTMAPVLPATATTGSTICLPSHGWVGNVSFPNPQPVQEAASGGSTTHIIAKESSAFTAMQVGTQVEITTGAQANKKAIITAVNSAREVTISPALGGTLAEGDKFVLQLPTGTATSGAAGTITDSAQAWPTNQYSNWDVVIVSGTGAGQRRRIASNTGTVITLAGAVTGNTNTGNWSVNPDATSVYKFEPSGDFLYFASANATNTMWSLDLSNTTPAAWVALANAPETLSGGSALLDLRGSGTGYIFTLRGTATKSAFYYNIGKNEWTAFTTFAGSETFSTGSSCEVMYNHDKIFIQKEGALRTYELDLATGIYGTGPQVPYAVPTANDGQRITYTKSPEEIDFLYVLRGGGTQMFRTAIEWGD